MTQHWTEESIDDFVHRLSFDFITQLAKRLEGSPSTRADLAAKLGVSKGRISQILNNPSNLTLKRAVSYARALGMKVSVVAYDDHDPNNNNGPVSSEIFALCWEKANRPSDFQSAESIAPLMQASSADNVVAFPERKAFALVRRSAKSDIKYRYYLDTNVLLAMEEANNSQQRSLAVGE